MKIRKKRVLREEGEDVMMTLMIIMSEDQVDVIIKTSVMMINMMGTKEDIIAEGIMMTRNIMKAIETIAADMLADVNPEIKTTEEATGETIEGMTNEEDIESIIERIEISKADHTRVEEMIEMIVTTTIDEVETGRGILDMRNIRKDMARGRKEVESSDRM